MYPDLQRCFDNAERQRTSLQSRIGALSEPQLNWTPNATVWSIGQIAEHLMLSDETFGHAQDAEGVKTEALMFRVMPRSWRRALILRAFKRDTVLPLPSPDVEPHGKLPLSQILARWEAARGEMCRVLGTLQGNENRYYHPVMGSLAAAQMLEIVQAHTAYHIRQIESLQRNPVFPPS